MRLIDLHCNWARQYAAESTQYDASFYPEIATRLGQVDGYLMGTSLAFLGCDRAAGDWQAQADPWLSLAAMIDRSEAEFAGRLIANLDDYDRWRADADEGLCWGLLNGFLIGKAKVPPLIVTLGTLGGALGLSQVITGGVDIRDVPPVLVDTIGYGNLPATTIPLISSIALVLVVIFGIVLHRTKFGLYTFAVGSKEQSARRVGIKVHR